LIVAGRGECIIESEVRQRSNSSRPSRGSYRLPRRKTCSSRRA